MTKPSKALRDKWYSKLKASGFEDIEDVNSPLEMLKTWDHQYFLHLGTPGQFQARQIYYQLCEDFLRDYKFLTKKDKNVWTLHSIGATLREISKKLRYPVSQVYQTVRRLKGLMEGIVYREATLEDKNFIYSTWLRGAYYGSDWMKSIKKSAFFEKYPKYIDTIIARQNTKVMIACLKSDKETILGYAVIGMPNVLYWMHVKEPWRKQGIGKGLLSGCPIDTIAAITKPGKVIAESKGWQFDPWV